MELVPFQNKEDVKKSIKKDFEKQYKDLLGDKYDEYLKYSLSYLTRSLRINTLKKPIKEVKKSLEKKGWILTSVPWAEEGFWIEHETGRLDIGNTREHALGYIYIQEAASMIPPLVLDPRPGEIVLDMCAAPGSKTTQIAQYMKNKGILVANDFTGHRMKPLGLNVQRMGLRNTVITKMYGQWFANHSNKFDKILVDAPCSGTGTIRKSPKTLRIWNPTMIKRLASTQKKLIRSAWQALKKDGILVYSTCSNEPIENEAVISHFINENEDAELQKINLDIKSSPVVMEFKGDKYDEEIKKCIRLWPQDNDTEGFFIAKIKKK